MKGKLIVFSAFLSLLLLFSSFSVKANDFAFPSFPEPEYSTHYLIVFNSSKNRYTLYKPKEPENVYVVKNIDNMYIGRFYGGAKYYTYVEGQQSWSEGEEINASENIGVLGESDIIIASSFDLKCQDGTIFFQKAPIKASFLTQMKKVRMGATLVTLVSLIPSLMVLVASFLAFRKALAWLSKLLRKV